MVALDQLELQQEGIPPTYELNGMWIKTNEVAKCDQATIGMQYSKIKEAGHLLGLEFPLTNNHAEKILTHPEKEYIWKNIIEDINQFISIKLVSHLSKSIISKLLLWYTCIKNKVLNLTLEVQDKIFFCSQ